MRERACSRAWLRPFSTRSWARGSARCRRGPSRALGISRSC